MCGIWLYLHKLNKRSLTYGEIYDAFMKIEARGPDRSHFTKLSEYGLYIGFHRLSIMDVSIKGDQPFTYETDEKVYYLVCNGEIYNYEELCKKYEITLHSGSDCEVLLHLFLKIGLTELVKELNAEYAFCICEVNKITKEVKLHISRDHLGVRPLFITGDENELVITSELKGSPFLFKEKQYKVQQFTPRHYATISNFDDNLYNIKYNKYIDFSDIKTTVTDLEDAKRQINKTFREAVKVKMMVDPSLELGCALSGGLDSSLVAAIASEYFKESGKKLKTFSIGLPNGTDEKYAKIVANHINSEHTHIEFTNKEFLEALEDVILCIESYDITSVRASTGQYLLAKWINENTDIKVILLGDISDELTNGYLYNYYAPDALSLHTETIRILNDIHYYDILRADRGITRSGLEARCPFDDNDFVKLYLSINPEFRMPTYKGLEKWLLREAFKNDNLLPDEVLFRIKCAFSDGVSSEEKSWFEIIQEHIHDMISDEKFEEDVKRYDHLRPVSKESLYFRNIFEKYFGKHEETSHVIPYYWLPKWVNTTEPSARTLDIYKEKMNIEC